MRHLLRLGLAALVGAIVVAGGQLPAHGAAGDLGGGSSAHDDAVAFWTPERVAAAVPRDFVYDPATGRFRQVRATVAAALAAGAPATASRVTGSSWPGSAAAGTVRTTTGKVLFRMGGDYYVCSGSVLADRDPGRSLVVTAAHCAYDEVARRFATEWTFIPDYDAAAVPLTTDGSFCASTRFGCWSARALVVDSVYAGAGGFTQQATRRDVAIAVVGAGGRSGAAQLDSTVGAQALSAATARTRSDTYLFGYPQASPFTGADLVYSRGPLGVDVLNAGKTYRVGSRMTGGASGGPWFTPFSASSGRGTQVSVTSYGYDGLPYLFGPIFGPSTSALVSAATTATVDTVVRTG